MSVETGGTEALSVVVPAAWVAQIDGIAAETERSRAEICREAIARYLTVAAGERDEIASLKAELSALQQQLARLDAIEAALARLSRRQDTLERSTPASDPSPRSQAAAAPATAAPPADAEDWGLFDDEPDEVLADFL